MEMAEADSTSMGQKEVSIEALVDKYKAILFSSLGYRRSKRAYCTVES